MTGLLPVLAILVLAAAGVLGAYGHRTRRKRSKHRAAAAPYGRDQRERIAREDYAPQPAGRNASEGKSTSRSPQPRSKVNRPGSRKAGEDGSSVQQEEAEDRHAGAEAAEPPASETGSNSSANEIAVERGADGSSPSDATREQPASEAGRDQNRQPSRPATHRDARGRKRQRRSTQAANHTAPRGSATRPPAEAKLRLRIHPIQKGASLSVVLTRPEGYPGSITLRMDSQRTVVAYDERRYDDLDLVWTTDLLAGELRVASSEGFSWVRSARQVHIFAEDPQESGLISVGAVLEGATHTIVCRSADEEAVQDAATATGSPRPSTNAKLREVPGGWTVLTGYAPVRAATHPLPAGLQPLDPATTLKIGFEGGLSLQAKAFAEGHPPRIIISPEPSGASVTIDDQPAILTAGGGWEAPGWDGPGDHMVDVTPGPSARYRIVADPWSVQGWEFWNGHPRRLGERIEDAWGMAEICGARIQGPEGQSVLAARTEPILVALGARSGASRLRRREAMEVAVGFVAEPPMFLLSAQGQRRTQGRMIWLGLAPCGVKPERDDPEWRTTIRWAAARGLQLEGGGPCEDETWQNAKQHARRYRKPRR